MTPTFLGKIKSFSRLNTILILYEKTCSSPIIFFSKNPGYQLLRYFGEVEFTNLLSSNNWELNTKWYEYKFCQGSERKPGGKETSLKRFTMVFN